MLLGRFSRRWCDNDSKSPVGNLVPKSLRKEPKEILPLKHQRDRVRNKQTHRIAPREEAAEGKVEGREGKIRAESGFTPLSALEVFF